MNASKVFHGVLPLHAGNSTPDLTPYLARRLVEFLSWGSSSDLVHYTSWITESWRVLSWSEPTSKLFWEVASLFCSPIQDTNNHQTSVHTTPCELRLSDLAIFLLLHVPSFSASPRINPAPPSTFNEIWPSTDPSTSSSSSSSPSVTTSLTPRSPLTAPARDTLLSPRSNTDISFGVNNLPSPRSPSNARSLGLWAVSSAETHRLDLVRAQLPDLLRAVCSVSSSSNSSDPSNANSSQTPSNLNFAQTTTDLTPLNELGLTRSDVNKLSFLITGANDDDEDDKTELELGSLVPQSAQTLWSQGSTWPASDVQQWLLAHLTVNDTLYPPTPPPQRFSPQSSPKTLSFETVESGGGTHSPPPSSMIKTLTSPTSPPKLVDGPNPMKPPTPHETIDAPDQSIDLLPRPTSPGTRPLPRVINSVSHHTVYSSYVSRKATNDDTPKELLGDLQVNHCHDAHLYLLEPFRFAALVGCSDCTIVVGAVQGMLRVVGCERIQVISACRRLSISSTLDSVFSVYCASAPVLFGDSRSCQFAPYNSAYSDLWEHLTLAFLVSGDPPCRHVNYWNSPLIDVAPTSTSSLVDTGPVVDASVGANMAQSEDREFKTPVMLPPHLFTTMVVPERKQQTTPQNPFPLPHEYAQVLSQRLESLSQIMQSVGEAAVSSDDEGKEEGEENRRSKIEGALRSHFADWLITSGNLRQVLDLVQLDREYGMK